MGEWSEQVKRQLVAALGECSRKTEFVGTEPGELWLWQAERRSALKTAMGIELPTVYGPPKSRIVIGRPDHPHDLQQWMVETEHGIHSAVTQQSQPSINGRIGAVVVHLLDREDNELQPRLCRELSESGLAVASITLRGGYGPMGIAPVAQVYLGVGRPYAGAVINDLLRVMDHLESILELEGDPTILVIPGHLAELGLAYAAIDQRINGIVVDLSTQHPLGDPDGRVPWFAGLYSHLGPNPTQTLIQCCVPRPITILNWPNDLPAWIDVPKSGVRSPADQLQTILRTYDIAGQHDRFATLPAAADFPAMLDAVRNFLSTHFAAHEA